MMLETLAKIESQMLNARKEAKRTQILKTVLQVLIAVFVLVLDILIVELIKE